MSRESRLMLSAACSGAQIGKSSGSDGPAVAKPSVATGSRRCIGVDTMPRRAARRSVLLALGAAALAGPLSCLAQPRTKVWRVGFLSTGSSPTSDSSSAFREGMREFGYVEDKNISIAWRFTRGEAQRLPGLAAELVQLEPDVIVAATPSVTRAVQKATSTIAIVMVNVADPVGSGFVKSLARPGGNITGTSTVIHELGPKQLEILIAVVPGLARVAVLVHPDVPDHFPLLRSIESAAKRLRIEIVPAEARDGQEIENAFSNMARRGAQAIIATAGPFVVHRRRIAELAAKHRLPSIAASRQYAELGGLLSYGPDPIEPYRRAATFVDKIFKGARPGELPVEEPTRFQTLVNGRTAKLLGISIPQSILVRADKVIE